MKRKWLWAGVALLLIGTMLSACANAKQNVSSPSSERIGAEMGAVPAAPSSKDVQANAVPEVASRLVIRNAQIALVVDDPSQTIDNITGLTQRLGGFVVRANLQQRQGSDGIERTYGTITVRVPAESFEQAVQAIKKMAVKVNRNDITGQDVTEEYVDLQARLKNLEAARDQLQRIMDEATTTEGVLQVYQQLTQVQGEIEQVKGRIKYLQSASAMSEIEVNLTPSEAAKPFTIGGWQPVGVAKDALMMTLRTLRGLANVVIWLLLYFVPVSAALVLVFGLPGWWLWRWAYRRWIARPKIAEVPPANDS